MIEHTTDLNATYERILPLVREIESRVQAYLAS
jgi:hypothetical protein